MILNTFAPEIPFHADEMKWILALIWALRRSLGVIVHLSGQVVTNTNKRQGIVTLPHD